MKNTINFFEFCDGFRDRVNFSYEGKRILFDFLENLEQETGEEIEYDPIGFCCEFEESSLDQLTQQYDEISELCAGFDKEQTDDLEKMREAIQEFLQDNTILCGITKDGNFIYQQF